MKTAIVQNLPKYLQFVSDSQDTQPIREHIGESANEFDSFFVSVGEGEYLEVWGMHGTVPYLYKEVFSLITKQ